MKVTVPDFAPDDVVRVIDDPEKLMDHQLSTGIEWTEDTCDVRITTSYLAKLLPATLYTYDCS